jgi:hypothetical protein
VPDVLSNVGRFKIIESTLREGEQFAKYEPPKTIVSDLCAEAGARAGNAMFRPSVD